MPTKETKRKSVALVKFQEVVNASSGSEVATALGVSPAYVSMLLSGQRGGEAMELGKALDIELAFGIPVHEWAEAA